MGRELRSLLSTGGRELKTQLSTSHLFGRELDFQLSTQPWTWSRVEISTLDSKIFSAARGGRELKLCSGTPLSILTGLRHDELLANVHKDERARCGEKLERLTPPMVNTKLRSYEAVLTIKLLCCLPE